MVWRCYNAIKMNTENVEDVHPWVENILNILVLNKSWIRCFKGKISPCATGMNSENLYKGYAFLKRVHINQKLFKIVIIRYVQYKNVQNFFENQFRYRLR